VGSKVPDAGMPGRPFHDVPNCLGRDSVAPDYKLMFQESPKGSIVGGVGSFVPPFLASKLDD